MKYIVPLLLTGSLLLAACAPTTSSPHEQTSGEHTPAPKGTENLMVRDLSTDAEIAFSIRDGDEAFDDYGVSHTKEMHLIIVRDDLRYFQHLHPVRDSEGIWRAPFTAPAGGTYWFYADFVDSDRSSHTIRFNRTYEGRIGDHGLVKDFGVIKVVDDYRFAVNAKESDGSVAFTYNVTDSDGQPVELEEYLGAMGHSILLSPSGDFIHTHPSGGNTLPVFVTEKPSDAFYRIFTQFKIDGTVHTATFDWKP